MVHRRGKVLKFDVVRQNETGALIKLKQIFEGSLLETFSTMYTAR